MSVFNKIGQGANRLFNKATGRNGIFNKVNEYSRKADNSIQRVGNFLRPIASNFGLDPLLQKGLNTVHDLRMNVVNASNDIRNGLERAVKAPINQINAQNYR